MGVMSFFSLFYSRAIADPQTLLEEKEAIEEKLATSEYELCLAQEDISKLKIELQKKNEAHSIEFGGRQEIHQEKRDGSSNLGLLKDNERQDLNCAAKEYMLIASYRLTAMTFYEEMPCVTTIINTYPPPQKLLR